MKQALLKSLENVMQKESNALLVTICIYFLFLVSSIQASLFPISTIILAHALPLPLLYLMYLKATKVHETGLVSYLPRSMQRFLLESSIFDTLCNIWFVPTASKYIKRFFIPFFVQMTREEAYAMFEEINPDFAAKLDTKGVANVLPRTLQTILLPKGQVQQLASTQTREEVPSMLIRPRLVSASEASTRVSESESIDAYIQPDEIRVGPKTELISSGSPIKKPQVSAIDRRISEITARIPTLKPLISQILGFRLRKLMSVFSNKSLLTCAIGSSLAVLLQLMFSQRARKFSAAGFKMLIFIASMGLLGTSVCGLSLKFLHERTQEPEKKVTTLEEVIQPKRMKRNFTAIKSRFESNNIYRFNLF